MFNHEWQPNDPLAGGDGVGPVFNAKSCVACHFQGGVGGSGGLTENVTLFSVFDNAGGCGIPFNNRSVVSGTLHAKAISSEFLETMDLLDRALPKVSQPTLEMLTANARNNRMGASRRFLATQHARAVRRPFDRRNRRSRNHRHRPQATTGGRTWRRLGRRRNPWVASFTQRKAASASSAGRHRP